MYTPFNLEEVLAGKKFGRVIDEKFVEPEEFHFFKNSENIYSFLVVFNKDIVSYTKEGRASFSKRSSRDLVMAPEIQVYYRNVHPECGEYAKGYATLGEALINKSPNTIGQEKVTVINGTDYTVEKVIN